jgi:benzoyl-CoA reductase/2-hydroxyglutaryl-CoA dehydratase subunit BcrC/BadD/HgdB
MAKGKKCPYCKTVMYAQSEKKEPKGSYVVYVCRNGNCNHTEKTFESN